MADAAFLSGDHVLLRPAEPADAEFLSETTNDARVWKPMFITSKFPTTREKQEEWIAEMTDQDDAVAFVVWVDGDRVGSLALFDIAYTTGTAEIGYHIAPDAQGNGYAADALGCLCRYAFDTLRLHKLCARTYGFNEASCGLLESLGFTEEGVHRGEGYFGGEYCDIRYYGLLASEHQPGEAT